MERKAIKFAAAAFAVIFILALVGPEATGQMRQNGPGARRGQMPSGGRPGLSGGGDKSGPPQTIIDVHGHLAAGMNRSGKSSEFESVIKSALEKMDRAGIKKMLVMPPPFPDGHSKLYDHECFASALAGYPDRFGFLGGGGILNPMLQKYSGAAVTDAVKKEFENAARKIIAAGAVGFGEIACDHLCLASDHNYQHLSADHPLLLHLADIAAELKVPIDIHMEALPAKMRTPSKLGVPPNPESLQPNIAAFEKLLDHNKLAKIVWSHAGWDQTGMRTAELTSRLLGAHPNLYLSIKICTADCSSENCMLDGAGNIRPEWLAVIEKYPDRFMIGCDEFTLPPASGKKIGPPSIHDTISLFVKLPRELKRKVAFENAQSVYNLK